MPTITESNGKTYLVYDFYNSKDGFPEFERTKDSFLKAENKPIVVIDVSFEGECNNTVNSDFSFLAGWQDRWNKVVSILSNYDLDKTILVYGDANVEQNYTKWCEVNNQQRVFGKCIYRPQTLLLRSLNHHEKVPMLPNMSFKPKHFICMNGASKEHRFLLVESLFANGWDTKGYISYLNRNGANTEWMATEFFRGQDLHLDFTADDIDFGPNQELIPCQYREACFDIVIESIRSDHSLFITEKTWKPILQKTPFIPLGSKGMVKHLEEYFGIKPYTDLFDYSFDNLDYPERLHRMKEDNFDRLFNMDIHELNEIVNSDKMQELLEYNKDQLLAFTGPIQDRIDFPLKIPRYSYSVS